jgi:phage terminase large subunit GpA-like protein
MIIPNHLDKLHTDSLYNELINVVESGRQKISNLSPSQWAEKYRVLTADVSAFPGPFTFDRTPYMREPLDLLSPDSPAKKIAVMKGGQIGFSTGVIENAIGWIIGENPGPTMYLSGHETLSEEAMNTKIDQMINQCGLRHLIRPAVKKKKNQRTGDTAKSKEFPGGSLVAGSSSNHSLLRQRSIRYGFYDDFENAPRASKESGSTERMIDQRHAAFKGKSKEYYISTPEVDATSNIKPLYLKGDQRKYMVPCPCCGVYISLEWSVDRKGTDGREKGGVTWKLDDKGRLIDGVLVGDENSVGYICQECGGFFDESHKYDMNLKGYWQPTAEPSEIGFYSYHISCLYAPPGMKNWEDYVRQFIEANPPGQRRKERLHQTFVNLALAETYEPTVEDLDANKLQKNNIRRYEIGTVPDKLSIADGNGRIVLLTCACDLNGNEKDARLDYEVLAWSESGSCYSVKHGSIGTFIPRENSKKVKKDRARWTYEHGRPNSVWPELTKVLSDKYPTDNGRTMRILMAGVDCAYHTIHAYAFIDKMNSPFRIGLRGKEESKAMKLGLDVATFRPAKERGGLYILEVNAIKDDLADCIRLQWDEFDDAVQPPGFMNFPIPGDDLYGYNSYFSHYEAEHRVVEKKDEEDVGVRWKKRNSAVQNHFWDVRVYNMVLRDITVDVMCKAFKIKKPTWADFVNALVGRK